MDTWLAWFDPTCVMIAGLAWILVGVMMLVGKARMSPAPDAPPGARRHGGVPLAEQKDIERRRQLLNRAAKLLVAAAPPADAHTARTQLDECEKLAENVYTLQHDINRLIERDGESEGRSRALAVAAMVEGLLHLRVALVKLHLHGFELADDPAALLNATRDEESSAALQQAARAIGQARDYIEQITPSRHRIRRLLRSLAIFARFRERRVDDVGAYDLVRSCDQAEQLIVALEVSVTETVNLKMSEQLFLLSSEEFTDAQIVAHLREMVAGCVAGKREPRDFTYPLLRIRLLEMSNQLMDLPSDWINLRWTALLYGFLGWLELFAAYASRDLNDITSAADHLQQLRDFYQTGQRWTVEASLHRAWRLRFQKAVSNSGVDQKHPQWGEVPSKREIEGNLQELMRAVYQYKRTGQGYSD